MDELDRKIQRKVLSHFNTVYEDLCKYEKAGATLAQVLNSYEQTIKRIEHELNGAV